MSVSEPFPSVSDFGLHFIFSLIKTGGVNAIVSISKVAKLAGVSSSTVSRVINNYPRVAPGTVQSVLTAMKELGYVPSDRRPGPKPRAGRRHSGNRYIAFLVLGASPDRATPGFEHLLRGVSLAASENERSLVFSHVPDAEHLPSKIFDHPIDGWLLHGAPPAPSLMEQLRSLPTVWLMGNRRRPEWGDQVMPDGNEIGDLAARYLIRQGHTCLAFLNLDALHWPFRIYAQSFVTTAAERGIQSHIVQQTPATWDDYWRRFSGDSVSELVDRFLRLTPRPSGLFVADAMQVSYIQPALQARGVEIGPERVEIIVSSNELPYLVGLDPKPAAIDLRIESIGRRGVEQLLWRLNHPSVRERIVATVEPFIPEQEWSPAQVPQASEALTS